MPDIPIGYALIVLQKSQRQPNPRLSYGVAYISFVSRCRAVHTYNQKNLHLQTLNRLYWRIVLVINNGGQPIAFIV